jgi:TorA maturation chaperone TorD
MGEPSDEAAQAENRARSECYALISRLFYAPPDRELLQRLAAEPGVRAPEEPRGEPPGSYAGAFDALQRASHSADADVVRQEYDDLFVGAGKALVTPYTSAYSVPNAPDRHLVTLRGQLAAWGLGRHASVFETEDHVSAVCDVMRWLIERGRSLQEQHAFFAGFVYTGVGAFCRAIESSASASYYRAVARLAHAFLEIENEAFALDTPDETPRRA